MHGFIYVQQAPGAAQDGGHGKRSKLRLPPSVPGMLCVRTSEVTCVAAAWPSRWPCLAEISITQAFVRYRPWTLLLTICTAWSLHFVITNTLIWLRGYTEDIHGVFIGTLESYKDEENPDVMLCYATHATLQYVMHRTINMLPSASAMLA